MFVANCVCLCKRVGFGGGELGFGGEGGGGSKLQCK